MLAATKQIMCIYLFMVLHLSKGILTIKTFKSEQPQCPLSVSSVASVLTMQDTLGLIKDSTLGKSLMNVNSVASVLADQET